MKLSILLMTLGVMVMSHGLTSCCSVPPAFCCSCTGSAYRPLGRTVKPGEAYSLGYLCGQRDQRDGRGRCWDRHREELSKGLEEYGARGYEDGYAGRVQTECSIPDQRKATRLYR